MVYYLVTLGFTSLEDPEYGTFYENYPKGIYTNKEDAIKYVQEVMYEDKYSPNNTDYHEPGFYNFKIYRMENNIITDTLIVSILDESYKDYEKIKNVKNMTVDEFISAFKSDNPICYEVYLE